MLLRRITISKRALQAEFTALMERCRREGITSTNIELPKLIKLGEQVTEFADKLLRIFEQLVKNTQDNADKFFTEYPILTEYMLQGSEDDLIRVINNQNRGANKSPIPIFLRHPDFLRRTDDDYKLFKFYCKFYQSTGGLVNALTYLKETAPEVFGKIIQKGMIIRLLTDMAKNEADFHILYGNLIDRNEIIRNLCTFDEVFTDKNTVKAIVDHIETSKNYHLFEQVLSHPSFVQIVASSTKLTNRVTNILLSQVVDSAKQLAHLNLHLMSLLQPRDFYQYQDRSTRAAAGAFATIVEVIQRVGRYVALSIVSEANKDVRNARIIQWILMADQLRKLHAYDISYFIVELLQRNEIKRLIQNEGITAIPDNVKKILDELYEFYSDKNNYKLYRAELASLETAQYAVLSPVLNRDITFSFDGNTGKEAPPEAPFSVLIKQLHDHSMAMAHAEEQVLAMPVRSLLAAADPAHHPLEKNERELDYLRTFFEQLDRPSGYGVHELWSNSGLISIVGATPDVKIISADDLGPRSRQYGKDLDNGFWNYIGERSRAILPRTPQGESADTTIVERIAGNTSFNHLAETVTAKASAVELGAAKTHEGLKLKQEEFLGYAAAINYQEALIAREQLVASDKKSLSLEAIEYLEQNNPYASYFFAEDEKVFLDQFILRYLGNWLGYVAAHTHFQLHGDDVIVKEHSLLRDNAVENYFTTLNLSAETKNNLRWFLSRNPDYLKKLSQQITAGINPLAPALLQHLEALGFDKEQTAIFTILANSVVVIRKKNADLYLSQYFNFLFDRFLAPASAPAVEVQAATTAASAVLVPAATRQSTEKEPVPVRVKPAVLPKPNFELLNRQRQAIKENQYSIERSLDLLQQRLNSYRFVSMDNTEARVQEQQQIDAARALLRSTGTNSDHAAELIKATPTFDINAVEAQHNLISTQLALIEEKLQEANRQVVTPARFVRLEPQLTPNSTQQDLQQLINQSLNLIELFPLRMLAERLNYLLASSTGMINLQDLTISSRDRSGKPIPGSLITEASRAYLTAMLFDSIGLFTLSMQELVKSQPNPKASYQLLQEKLQNPEEIVAKTWKTINAISHKLAPNVPVHLFLNPEIRVRMEMFHRQGKSDSLVIGAASFFERIYCMTSKEFRDLPFSASKLDITQDDGSILSLDVTGCHSVKDVLMNLAERDSVQPLAANNRVYLQILNEMMHITYVGLLRRMHIPTLAHTNVVHAAEPITQRHLLRLLMDWHALYQSNMQLRPEHRVTMQAFEDLFIPEMRGLLQTPKLTGGILRRTLLPEHLYYILGHDPHIAVAGTGYADVSRSRMGGPVPGPAHVAR